MRHRCFSGSSVCRPGFSEWVMIASLLLAAAAPLPAEAWSEILLVADRDNTLYETDMDAPEDPNEVSNGAGIFLFAGRTNVDSGFRLRRGLVRFDLSVLPAGSEIIFAELTLYQSNVSPNAFPVTTSLHRLLEDWGEGGSDGIGPEGQGAPAQPGDATWFQSFYNSTTWSDAGGTFEGSASASTTIGLDLGDYTWGCSPALVADTQAWLDDSAANFGWLILGNEDGGGTVRRFNSRSNSDEETRPRLRVVFRPPGEVFTDGFEAAACSP
jgi:hypothetical protein